MLTGTWDTCNVSIWVRLPISPLLGAIVTTGRTEPWHGFDLGSTPSSSIYYVLGVMVASLIPNQWDSVRFREFVFN